MKPALLHVQGDLCPIFIHIHIFDPWLSNHPFDHSGSLAPKRAQNGFEITNFDHLRNLAQKSADPRHFRTSTGGAPRRRRASHRGGRWRKSKYLTLMVKEYGSFSFVAATELLWFGAVSLQPALSCFQVLVRFRCVATKTQIFIILFL